MSDVPPTLLGPRSPRSIRSTRRRARAVAVAAVVLTTSGLVSATPTTAVAVSGSSSSSAPTTYSVSARAACAKQGKPFRPTSLGIEGIITPRKVLSLGRDARGVPQAPPLSPAGKQQFAWDAQDAIKAGSKHGVIKLNAHTYPDGSALGNTLINQLYVGNRMVVRGARGQLRCYDVVDRVQIPAEKRFRRYYRTDGPGRLAIAVCSGVRRGPGDWSHRTIWFATLVR